MNIRVGILGYGNLGRGVELALRDHSDMQLKAIFTRRKVETVKPLTSGIPTVHISEIKKWKNEIDVLILCGGSATDLPKQTAEYAKYFNVIDSFDTHANIPVHFENVNKTAKETQHTAIISVGWDPGLFSLARLYARCILPYGKDYTFWGKGVSQGHSDAIRRIEGVKDAKQYTIPVKEALEIARSGQQKELSTRQKHTRECFVVAKEGADLERIEKEIKTMPNYFDEYDTTVHFISEEELEKNHNKLPHGGIVIRTGETGENGEHTQVIEYSLKLDSNPEFTSQVLVAYARACMKMNKENKYGCKTVFDVAPSYLSNLNEEELRKTIL